MIDLHVSTELFRLVSEGAFADLQNLPTALSGELSALSGLTAFNTTPVITSTSITYSDATGSIVLTGQNITLDGSGNLVAGTLSAITVTAGGQTVVSADFSTSQISLEAGSYSATLDGTFPTEIAQLFSVVAAVVSVAMGGTLSPEMITALAPYSLTGMNLSDGSSTLADLHVSASEIWLAAAGFTLTLDGTFPTDLGSAAQIFADLFGAFNGGDFNPADYPGLTLTDLFLTAPGGDTLLNTTGTFEVVGGELVNSVIATGTSGADVFPGTDFADIVHGLAGNDSLSGGDGNDRIFGDIGFDSLYGGNGNDTIDGGTGRDRAFLGNGDDLFIDNDQTGTFGRDTVWAGNGNDSVQGGAGDDAFHGDGGNDTIQGGDGNDLITGDAGFDSLYGGNGNDTVDGGDGRDRAFLGNGDDLFVDNGQTGLLGRDTVWAGTGNDSIQGGAGDDVFHGEGGNDTVEGGDGNDRLFGEAGFDSLYGGNGNDTVDGGDGRDRVFLGAGDDVFIDNAQGTLLGRDTVWGGIGRDSIQGGAGDDAFHGDGGNDTIQGGDGNDLITGGAGFDSLYGGTGNDTIDGGDGRDRVFLGAGNDLFIDNAQADLLGSDTVWAGIGNDSIQGGGGNDVFHGEGGSDTIQGGAGFDTLDGGAGNDVLTGGADDDVFVFNGGADRITDFTLMIDILELDSTLWGGSAKTAAEVVSQYATVSGGDAVLDFGSGNVLTLEGVTDLSTLQGDLSIL